MCRILTARITACVSISFLLTGVDTMAQQSNKHIADDYSGARLRFTDLVHAGQLMIISPSGCAATTKQFGYMWVSPAD